MKAKWDRREFLKTASAATLGALAAGAPVSGLLTSCKTDKNKQVLESEAVKNQIAQSKADTVILLWMAGGMAHTDTFNPKRYTHFEKGMDSNQVLSTFKSVPTVLDDISFSEGLESIGQVIDKGTLIRSYVAADLGFILHSRHQYHWH